MSRVDKRCVRGVTLLTHANASKTWLITKSEHLASIASATFAGSGVQVTPAGRPYLGAAIGTSEFVHSYVESKVAMWMKELDYLATFAVSQPHAAHSAFTHGFSNKWSYLSRTIPGIGSLLQPLESSIRSSLIPALTGQPPPNDGLRDLFALPARLGGLALSNPVSSADDEYLASTKISDPLKCAILQQSFEYSDEIISLQCNAKSEIRKLKHEHYTQTASTLKLSLSSSLQRSMDLAQEKGSSSWLTSLPIHEFGFALHKGAFHDALALRYNWPPLHSPSTCACGQNFSVEHALSCPKGGFTITRHNEIRDLTSHLLTEVCNDVCIEPSLQSIDGESFTGASSNTQDGARLDIAANGFWGGRFERTFFDVRIFNPHAQSNCHSRPTACYRKHELIKKRQYEQRVREVEHASFTPLVLSATGGMAKEATIFYKRLALCLSSKWDHPYSKTLSWLRSRITFSLLRSAIQCIRGARSSVGHAARSHIPPLDLVCSELQSTT